MCYQDDMLCPEMASHRLCGSTWEMGRRQGLARPGSIQAVQAMHSHRHDIDVVSNNDAMQRTQGSVMMRMVDCCGVVESGRVVGQPRETNPHPFRPGTWIPT